MNLAKYIDHTLLKPSAGKDDIIKLCAEAKKYGFASVCVNSSYVKLAKKELEQSDVKVCTVIGFPLGACSTKAKAEETKAALADGCDEFDMVIHIGALKEKDFGYVKNDIKAVVDAANGKCVKVIIETCLLTDEEKIKMCRIVTEAGADFIKTSTGFSKAGATFADIKLFSENIGEGVKMKAAGGISSMEDAEEFIRLGAERLGTSRIVKIVKKQEAEEGSY